MFHCDRVDISPREEAIIARDMAGSLSGSNSQIVQLILHLLVINVQLVPRVVAVRTMGDLVLSLEETSVGGVSLSR